MFLYAPLTHGIAGVPGGLCRWDCGWYSGIAANGYDIAPSPLPPYEADWAFFPVFPLSIRFIAWLFHLPVIEAGFATANLGLVIFTFLAIKYYAAASGRQAGLVMAAFILAYPYSFYFSVPYTESMYAALTVIFLFLQTQKRFFLSSIAAGLLAGTRVNGLFFTVVIMAQRLRPVVQNWRLNDRQGTWRAARAAVLPIALSPLGLFLFMAYLYFHMGDAFAFAHIQKNWGRTLQNPVIAIWHGLTLFDTGNLFSTKKECATYAAIAAIAGLLMCLRLLMTKRFVEGWILGSTLLIALSAGLGSMPRYVFANPVFIIYLFDMLWRPGRWFYFAALLLVCLALQICLVHLWVQSYVSLI